MNKEEKIKAIKELQKEQFKAQITKLDIFKSGINPISDYDFKRLIKLRKGDYIEINFISNKNGNTNNR